MGLFSSGKKSLRQGRTYAWNDIDKGRVKTEEAWQQSLPELMKGLMALEGGYDAALGEVANVGAAARQRTTDRGEQLVGNIKQDMATAGLDRTTVGGNLERGVNYDTNLALGEIDDSLAQLRSGLRVGKGQAMYQGYGGLANAYTGRGQQQYNEHTDRANVSLGMAANLAAADQFQTSMGVSLLNTGMTSAAEAAPDDCCFIFLEARYGNGTMDKVVRKYRDEHMTERNRRGYYKVAEVLVPLMRKSRLAKCVVKKTLCDPLVWHGKWFYGKSRLGWLCIPFKAFWLGVFDIVGGETEFLRENGEYV